MLLLAPAAMVTRAAVKLPPVPGVTLPKLSVIVPWAKPAGQVSATEKIGRASCRERVKMLVEVRVTTSTAVTVVTPSLLVIDRSALVINVSVSVAVLLVLTGSLVLLETVAVLVWVPGRVEDGTV